MAINTQKVVVGGLAAGVVMNVLDFVTNGVILKSQNAEAMNALNASLAANAQKSSAMITWVLCDFVMAILLTWLYAAMRPRFGAGPRTAVNAAIAVWVVGGVIYMSMVAVGMFTLKYFLVGAVTALITLLITAQVGAMLYKEEA